MYWLVDKSVVVRGSQEPKWVCVHGIFTEQNYQKKQDSAVTTASLHIEINSFSLP